MTTTRTSRMAGEMYAPSVARGSEDSRLLVARAALRSWRKLGVAADSPMRVFYMRCALLVLLVSLTVLAPAAAQDRRISASQAVLMMQNPNDDLNLNYYAQGVIDAAIGTTVSCTDVHTPFVTIVADAKHMAREFVAQGQGERKFGLLVIAALIKAGCVAAPSRL